MQIYIFKNNEQFGPFDAAQIEEYIKTSVFAMEDFAWSEGEPEWIPLSNLLLKQSQMPDYKGVDTVPSPIENEEQQEVEAKILTAEIAERFLKDNDSIYLGEFTLIEPAAAQVLAKHKGELNLSGLTSLSDKSAMELSKHKGLLVLVNLASLSNTGAEALVQSKWSGNKTSLIASKNVEITISKAKARVEAKLQAQAQAQSIARVKAKAEAEAEAKAQDERSELIKNTLFILFFVVTPIFGIIFLFILFTQSDSLSDSQVSFFAIAGSLGICLPFLGGLILAALHGDSDPQQRNAQIAMIQRQQMMNKIDDIRSDLSDE